MNPLISIIIPIYNRESLIKETLQSIIAQSYKNWECIIIDDHSTDNTFFVTSEIAKNDSRMHIYKRPDSIPKGPSACRNYGFKKSSGQYINWFDSDDLMMPNKLEVDLKSITSDDYDFTISQTQFFDNKSKENIGFWNDSLFSDNPINDFITMKIGWSTNA
ncbi:MAG: glycosyltransferase family 2 protein, partial [Arcobacter sp.]|nr:glycosyltransferase family 2 protein [Arcobacter sp.]